MCEASLFWPIDQRHPAHSAAAVEALIVDSSEDRSEQLQLSGALELRLGAGTCHVPASFRLASDSAFVNKVFLFLPSEWTQTHRDVKQGAPGSLHQEGSSPPLITLLDAIAQRHAQEPSPAYVLISPARPQHPCADAPPTPTWMHAPHPVHPTHPAPHPPTQGNSTQTPPLDPRPPSTAPPHLLTPPVAAAPSPPPLHPAAGRTGAAPQHGGAGCTAAQPQASGAAFVPPRAAAPQQSVRARLTAHPQRSPAGLAACLQLLGRPWRSSKAAAACTSIAPAAGGGPKTPQLLGQGGGLEGRPRARGGGLWGGWAGSPSAAGSRARGGSPSTPPPWAGLLLSHGLGLVAAVLLLCRQQAARQGVVWVWGGGLQRTSQLCLTLQGARPGGIKLHAELCQLLGAGCRGLVGVCQVVGALAGQQAATAMVLGLAAACGLAGAGCGLLVVGEQLLLVAAPVWGAQAVLGLMLRCHLWALTAAWSLLRGRYAGGRQRPGGGGQAVGAGVPGVMGSGLRPVAQQQQEQQQLEVGGSKAERAPPPRGAGLVAAEVEALLGAPSQAQQAVVVEQVMVGVLLFVPLLALLPTTACWYLAATGLRLLLLLSQAGLKVGARLVGHDSPLLLLAWRGLNPLAFPGQGGGAGPGPGKGQPGRDGEQLWIGGSR
ncbi:hypothetical protein V8C86DRAFT_862684 [Haematococcus lacustris]